MLIILLYTLNDRLGWWTGESLYFVGTKSANSASKELFLGMNPITIYLGHEVFNHVPMQWPVDATSHWKLMLMNVWGAAFWTLVAYYMHMCDFYVTI